MLNFAIIGFGGLGKVHYRNVEEVARRVQDVKLTAICDVEKAAFESQTQTNLGENPVGLELSEYHLYQDVDALFDSGNLDFVITALPTYLHEKIAVMAMERGIHVFSEKPMALTLEQAENMLSAARKSRVKLMIGQCVRYFPEYVKLREYITSGEYGRVVRADFTRHSPLPAWTWQNWSMEEGKSGGAALDLHVHDVDYISWVFGMPKAVSSFATNDRAKHDSISTVYHYDDMLVTATAEWGLPGCFPFTPGFLVKFERAAVVSGPAGMKLYPEGGGAVPVEVADTNGYVEEVVDFIHCIREGRESAVNPPEASLETLKIALAEKLSADTGKMVAL